MNFADIAKINEVVAYDPLSGIFTWKIRRGRCAAGAIAGTQTNHHRYISLQINGVRMYAHRLAFLVMTGKLPKGVVDHINGNSKDNRWANLRDCTQSENMANRRGHQRNSKTGLLGASPHASGKFIAQIIRNKKHTYIGLYDTAAEAHDAYKLFAKGQQ